MRPEDDIQIFEQLLNDLIVKYEQYFLGLEKREPLKLRDDVERLARKYQPIQINNTMYRFRYTSLIARLVSYQQHWNRILRLMEEGKYSRDKFKMEMHERQKQARQQPQEEIPEEPDEEHRFDPKVERLYRQYLAARQACKLSVDDVSADQIASALEKQRPMLLEKFNCSDIEFKVVVVEGKPKIKAVPVP